MDFGISGGIKDVLAKSLPRNTEKAHGQMWVSAGDVQ
jgi:hypothetical protein